MVIKGLRNGALAAFLLMAPVPADALTLTVGGTSYDVTLNLGSYDTVNAGANGPLTGTPWFGDETLAGDLANELAAQDALAGGTLVPDANGAYLFVHYAATVVITNIDYEQYGPSGGAVVDTDFSNKVKTGQTQNNGATLYFATGSVIPAPAPAPAAVPEIDGNALAKALFILFALGAWLHTRRRVS
ncbi:MAG: hypothetical protein ACE368_22595 [Paracoccaceae bacterium]